MPKTNIYVSVSSAKTQPIEGESEHTYRKPQPIWYLSTEQKKPSIPCIPWNGRCQPVHFGATPQETSGLYRVETHNAAHDESMIIGNILVAEKAKTKPNQIFNLLKSKLTTESSSLPSEQTDEGNPDAWIRKALHLLQNEKILDTFDVGEFMTFAHSYAANRTTGEAAAMVAYPRLNKHHEKKAKSSSYWVDYPMANKPAPRDMIEGNQRKYGSLM